MGSPEFWVAVALLIFLFIAKQLGAFRAMVQGLDGRAERVRGQLDEAVQLRGEAEALLADVHRRKAQAEIEAQAIIAQARLEAEQIKAETLAKTAEFVARRQRLAETKIAQAEAQAIADVRAAATDAAVAAAERVLRETVTGDPAHMEKAVAEVRAQLH